MLIVGLGNIGEKYARTRHNAGFMVVDRLLDKLGKKADKLQCKAEVCETYINSIKTVIAKPTTYMNLSGESVKPLLDRYNFKPQEAIIIYDDIDLPEGAIRYRDSGSAGTHNGMRSVIACVGTTQIPRLRIGVGLDKSIPLADYVLGEIKGDRAGDVFAAMDSAVEVLLDKLGVKKR